MHVESPMQRIATALLILSPVLPVPQSCSDHYRASESLVFALLPFQLCSMFLS